MGQASEPARFPSPLFLVSLGLVGARSLGNYTESRHIKCEMKALSMTIPKILFDFFAPPPQN
jgi:hypothetical protein